MVSVLGSGLIASFHLLSVGATATHQKAEASQYRPNQQGRWFGDSFFAGTAPIVIGNARRNLKIECPTCGVGTALTDPEAVVTRTQRRCKALTARPGTLCGQNVLIDMNCTIMGVAEELGDIWVCRIDRERIASNDAKEAQIIFRFPGVNPQRSLSVPSWYAFGGWVLALH